MTSQAIVIPGMIKTPPREAHSPAYRLFNYPRRCQVQQIFSLSENQVAYYGLITTGDPERDRENRQAWVDVTLTVVGMCDVVERGGGILFNNADDAAKAYLDIVAHLRDWLHVILTDPLTEPPPFDDFRQLDEMAGMLFPYANPILMTKEEDSAYGNFLGRVRRGGRSLMRRDGIKESPGRARGIYRSLSMQIAEAVERNRTVA